MFGRKGPIHPVAYRWRHRDGDAWQAANRDVWNCLSCQSEPTADLDGLEIYLRKAQF